MADESNNELRIASAAQISGLEHASKQFSKQLHERRSTRAADWLARAELQGKVNQALLELAEKENPKLRSLFQAAKKSKSKRVKSELKRPGLDQMLAFLAHTHCNCSAANSHNKSITPSPRNWSGFGTGLAGWGPFPGSITEDCLAFESGSVNQFNMGWGPFLSLAGGNFSPFINLTENAVSNNKSTASGTTMLGFLWQAPIDGFLFFSGAGSFSWDYTLDCAWAMAEVDAHIGTSLWNLGPQTGAPVNQWDAGDQQVFMGQSNFTNQTQSGPVLPFSVNCGSNTGTCPGFSVVAGNNYILWTYFELNAFQGSRAQSWPNPVFAEAFAAMSVFLQSIDWTLYRAFPILRR